MENRIGETWACIEPARNPLTRLNDDTACVQAARNPLREERDSASLGRVLWSLINR